MLMCFMLVGVMVDWNVLLNNRMFLNFWICVLNFVLILLIVLENICCWDLYSLMCIYGDMMEEVLLIFKLVIFKIFMIKLLLNLLYLREKCRVLLGRDEVEVLELIELFVMWLGDMICGCKLLSYYREWKIFIKICMNLILFNRIKI